METIRELCSFEGRLAGTDAERRAANRLAERLAEIGRKVEVEPTYVHPQTGLIVALHCLLGFAGSLVAISEPAVGFALVLVAATSLYLDLSTRVYLLRRMLFRRASQNVVSPPRRRRADVRLVLSAHCDAARTGAIFQPKPIRRVTRIAARLPFPFGPFRLVFWSLALLLPLLGARMAGLDSDAVSLLQLAPTLVLLIAVFAGIEIELSPVAPGANDDASGVATVLSLAQRLEAEPPERLDVWVVLTGGQECLMEGMRDFLRRHRRDFEQGTTYFVCIDSVGRGEVRYVTGEGLAVTYAYRSRLTELCAAIADAGPDGGGVGAKALRHGFATDSFAAAVRRYPATTITCLEPGAILPAAIHSPDDKPAAIDPDALERAGAFAFELIRQLDRDAAR